MLPWRLSVHTAAPAGAGGRESGPRAGRPPRSVPAPGSGRAPRPDLPLGADRGRVDLSRTGNGQDRCPSTTADGASVTVFSTG
jgi:hypothetical protein